MAELTLQQKAAVESGGKVIVSASAGSGKTFAMIEKLTRAIESGVDLDEVLAVTFTKKAAAQMKEKLRGALIKRVENAGENLKIRLKAQIAKIPSANISTIHSFCARLLRTYFYVAGIDGGFDIMAADDSFMKDLQTRAIDNVFERRYESGDGEFLHLLDRFTKKRSDENFRALVLENYGKARSFAGYKKLLDEAGNIYTEQTFAEICEQLKRAYAVKFRALAADVRAFENSFPATANGGVYKKIFGEMLASLEEAQNISVFEPLPPIAVSIKPRDAESDKPAGELFKAFRTSLARRYSAVREGIGGYDTELARFLESGKTAVAFSRLVSEFDDEYFALKKDENKLDYNDLEHLTLQLLQNDGVRGEISEKYRHVYVDEYQDVNPVQEQIISAIGGGEVFLVGDVKQAIYGFRGSKSLFFAEKFHRFEGGEGKALKLSGNFRSGGAVTDFVNRLFSDVMREESCGFNYKNNSEMTAAGAYPPGYGKAGLYIYGKDEKAQEEDLQVYSVVKDSRPAPHSREGLAVLQIVENELKSRRFDLKTGDYVDTRTGDICILTRKSKTRHTEEIVRALRDAGYPVSGADDGNICETPEVKNILDVLSLIDNAEQDIPLVTAMLSPLGKFTEDELAGIRIASKGEKRLPFRECCKKYLQNARGETAQKLAAFYKKLDTYRDLAEILTAGEIIDKLLCDTGLEAEYSAGSGEKLKNVLRLAAEGPKLSLPLFLQKIKAGGYNIKSPSSAPSDSIKVMTMHASKGLEFPVVIISDICRQFKGKDSTEIFLDGQYGFAPKMYDPETMLVYPTVLRKLAKLRSDREELKNELNLFYVACTRAMCNLYVLASEVKKYSPYEASEAKCYAQTFDMSVFAQDAAEPRPEIQKTEDVICLPKPDDQLFNAVSSRFMRAYPHAESVELPVKSSASAILRSMKEDELSPPEHILFPAEGETGTDRGTAYHRFLELCDFSKKSGGEIAAEIKNFTADGKMSESAASLLNAAELSEILNMPVFGGLDGAELYREREFLCRLPACEIFDTPAEDFVLVQGAIDLLICSGGGVRIIDYKYSGKTDEQLIKTYSPQLALYKKAVSRIMKTPEESIGVAIVNIKRKRQIILS